MTDGLQTSSAAAGAHGRRVLVVIASVDGSLLRSDQAAATQAVARFRTGVMVSSRWDDETALSYALAAGAAEIVTLKPGTADLVVFGSGGIEPEGERKAAELALAMNACLVFDVLDFETAEHELVVTRDLGRGSRERLTVGYPAVFIMSKSAQPTTYISRFRRWQGAARARKQLDTLEHNQDFERATTRWEAARPRSRRGESLRKTAGDSQSRMFAAFGLANDSTQETNEQHLVTGTAEACALHLVRYLAHHGFVESRVPLVTQPGDASVTSQSPFATHRNLDKSARQSHSNSGPPLSRAVDVSKIRRAPRPLKGAREGIWRSPRPYCEVMPRLAKLARGPRAVGQTAPSNLRGPYPISSEEP